MNATPTPATTNKMTLADLDRDLKELGEQAGKGKDTQVKALLKMVEASYHGLVDLDPNKHGTGVDDATKRAETYVKAQTGSTVFDAKAPNQRKLISCFRTAEKLGGWTKGGAGEPLSTLNDLMTVRQKLKQQPGMAKKLDDAANTVLKYARAQLKRDQLIDIKELESFCFKPVADTVTAEEVLESARKGLKRLYDGKAGGGNVQDASDEVKHAIDALTKRLRAIAIGRGVAKQNGGGNKVAPIAPIAKAQAATLAALTLSGDGFDEVAGVWNKIAGQ